MINTGDLQVHWIPPDYDMKKADAFTLKHQEDRKICCTYTRKGNLISVGVQ